MSVSTPERRAKPIVVNPVTDYSAADHAQPRRTIADAQMPIALIRCGSRVLCIDGKAGTIARVLAHPERSYPTHIVVQPGRFRRRQVRVALNWIRAITPDQIELNLWKDELAAQPEYRPDDEIAEDLEAAFHGADAFHDRGDYLAIRVSASAGIVTLRGNVRNSPRRIEAEQIARRIRGVVDVDTLLVADSEIEWTARWVLQHDPRLQLRDLRAEAMLGLVRLYGRVGSDSQRALATAIIRQVPGVHTASNQLVVDPALQPARSGRSEL